MTEASPSRLAILVDAENVSAACWPAAVAIAGRFGTATIVRAYVCHAPTPGWVAAAGVEIVDGRPANGPNAADFLLAMDAAVMAAERQVDGFVLVTGDDGFAAVALDLKRRGAAVYALVPLNGSMVPRRLATAADLTVLLPSPPTPAPTLAFPKTAPPSRFGDTWTGDILAALARCPVDEDGWTTLSDLGQALKDTGVKKPKGKLFELVRGLDDVEIHGTKAKTRVRPRFCLFPPGPAAWSFLDEEVPAEELFAEKVEPFDDNEIPF